MKSKTAHNVVMFRLEKSHIQTLEQINERDPVPGIHSKNTYARKIVTDFLEGRLEYTDDRYRFIDMSCPMPRGPKKSKSRSNSAK